jgi:hypothetical protein
MRLDFWNNPLVVSALRVRYRGGGISQVSTVWLMLLVAVGLGMDYFRDHIEPPWELGIRWTRLYFLILYGGQWVVSCAVASFTVAASMHAEVANRTLDFQRIAALRPREMLLGKMFGEPVQAYLMALAALPLAVWCWGIGVPGLTLPVLALLYLNLFTSILLFSAAGLVVKVEQKEGKPTGGGAGLVVWFGPLVSGFVAAAGGASVLSRPAAVTVMSLVAPVPGFASLVQGDAFAFPASFFGVSVPALLLTPLCQLAAAAVFFRVMERRLRWPLAPALGKPLAYLLLAVIDLVAAALLADPAAGTSTVQRVVVFGIVHLAAGVVLLGLTMPGGEGVAGWVWRYRGRCPWWRDLAVGERSPADLVGPVFAVIGGVILGLGVLWPALAQNGPAGAGTAVRVALAWWGLVTLLTLVVSGLSARLTFVPKVESMPLVLVLLGLIDLSTYGVGCYYDLDAVRQLSATGLAASWLGGQETLSPVPLLVIYAVLAVLAWLGWRRRLRKLEAEVDAQLGRMGVVAGKAP